MNGFENIEKKIEGLGRKTTPETDSRILNDAFAAIEQVPRQPESEPATNNTFIFRAAAAVIIIAVILGLVFVINREAQPPEKIAADEITPQPPQELIVAEPNAEEKDLPAETIEELQTELERIVVLAQAGDVNGLLAVLDEGSGPARMLAANYLAQIGDLRIAEILEALAAELTPNDANSIFLIAAETIEQRYAEPADEPVEAVDFNDTQLEPLEDVNDKIEWNCSLAGYILNENNEPLVGASVGAAIGEERFQATSDSNGWYEFKNLPNDINTQIIPYFDGYGYNLFSYDRADCNSRLDIQIFPQAYDWYGQPAPPLLIRKWLNCEPFSLKALRGNVVLLYFVGDCTKPGDHIDKIEELYDYYSDQNDIRIILLNDYVEPNSPKEDELFSLAEAFEAGLPIAIDEQSDAAKELVLPDDRRFEQEHISIKRSRLSSYGATNSIYQVRQRPAYFLIDKAGVLRSSAGEKDLDEWINRLLAE